MYTNIPVSETIDIINLQLQELQESPIFIKQLVNSLNVALTQNNLTFNGEYYNQTDGLPMGSPISPIMSEIFLQYLEDQHIEKIKKQYNIIFYCRYVDDIFIIYDNHKDIDDKILDRFNNIHSKIQYTLEKQQNNSLNYLDLSIQKITYKHIYTFQYKIFRKPTTSKLSINYNSDHPHTHKWANFHFLLNRLNNIPLSSNNYKKEFSNILQIAKHNKFPISRIYKLNSKTKKKLRTINIVL